MRTYEPPEFDFLSLSRYPSPGAVAPGAEPAARKSGPSLVFDLRSDAPSSQHFFEELGLFRRQVLTEVDRRAGVLLEGYHDYAVNELCESHRTYGEYAVELLTVGMALHHYGEVSAETPGWIVDLAQELVCLRRRSSGAKPLLDLVRSGLFRLFMTRGLRGSRPVADTAVRNPGPNPRTPSLWSQRHGFDALPRVIGWMQATGEFQTESRRLDNWLSYFRSLPVLQAESWIDVSLGLFAWFQDQAELALGMYTAAIRDYLEPTWNGRLWREEQVFGEREPSEYHLAIVASDVMNHAMQVEFGSHSRNVRLVPSCSCGKNSDSCSAPLNRIAAPEPACDLDCLLHRIDRVMRANGVEAGAFSTPLPATDYPFAG